MDENNLFSCPSCDFLVFSGPVGSYKICGICGWEDDHVQLKYPGMCGGPNKGSLKEYQGNKRNSKWCPLKKEVIDSDTGVNYFQAATEGSPDHHWLNERHDENRLTEYAWLARALARPEFPKNSLILKEFWQTSDACKRFTQSVLLKGVYEPCPTGNSYQKEL